MEQSDFLGRNWENHSANTGELDDRWGIATPDRSRIRDGQRTGSVGVAAAVLID
jgi:hypothetical protein